MVFVGIKVNILEDGRGVEVLAEGVVHGRDIIDAHEKIYDEDCLRRQRYQIVDKSACTEYAVTADDIDSIAELDRKASVINPNIVIAVIEARGLQFSLTELWQAHLAECTFLTKSFRDRETAMKWIAENAKQP